MTPSLSIFSSTYTIVGQWTQLFVQGTIILRYYFSSGCRLNPYLRHIFRHLSTIEISFSYIKHKEPRRTSEFQGSWYWRVTDRKIDPGYPKLIRSSWGGIPDDIDSAFQWGKNSRTYFVKRRSRTSSSCNNTIFSMILLLMQVIRSGHLTGQSYRQFVVQNPCRSIEDFPNILTPVSARQMGEHTYSAKTNITQ